jgi:D-arabinono-1,4-lactone oxidase
VNRTDPAFLAAIGALGATGILTRLQVHLVNELFFQAVLKIKTIKDILTDLDETSHQYDFWRIDWIPDTDNGLFWGAWRIPLADKNGDYPEDTAENILVALYHTLDKIANAGPLLDTAMRLVYTGLTLSYSEVKTRGPLRNMLPVDRRTPLHVAMAEWSFNPADLNRLFEACREYYKQHGWPNLPIEIELTKTDSYFMSPWNWPGLDYIIKFNFMYLTDIVQPGPERELIYTHLRGLWDHLQKVGIPFKAHWGKINFMDPGFVARNYQFEQFKPYIHPLFLNQYLRERFGM